MTPYLIKKKEEKRQALLNAAHKCFIKNGVSNTSIAEICKDAGVAKGTFYLYFANKDELLTSLHDKLSIDVVMQAHEYAHHQSPTSFPDEIVLMMHYMITYFKKDPEMVKMMNKDFKWPIDEKTFMDQNDTTLGNLKDEIFAYSHASGLSIHALLVRVFSIVTLVTDMCYSCLIDHKPFELDDGVEEFENIIRILLTR